MSGSHKDLSVTASLSHASQTSLVQQTTTCHTTEQLSALWQHQEVVKFRVVQQPTGHVAGMWLYYEGAESITQPPEVGVVHLMQCAVHGLSLLALQYSRDLWQG